MIQGNIDNLVNEVNETLKNLDNRIFINFNEKNIQLIYFTLMQDITNYDTYSEYPSAGGYIDLYIKSKELNNYSYIIEFKYIKESENTDKKLTKCIEEAKSQLVKYISDERINKNHLKKYIIIYSGRNLLKEIEI